MEIGETLLCQTADQWRAWLAEHHQTKAEIWLISFKKAKKAAGTKIAGQQVAAEQEPSRRSLDYDSALDEAVCFGWIDTQIRRIDDARYATRWCPRRPRGNWTEGNRARVLRLHGEGRMAPSGLATLPADVRALLGLAAN